MRFVAGLMAMASVAAFANTGTVTVELSGDESAFEVAFDNHAHETNSLWVVYGSYDYGLGTNGWDHVERLGTVTPETNTWTYATPSGWGDRVRAIRFILSEVPYDYDYSTAYTAADQIPVTGTSIGQCIRIDNDEDFTMDGSYRIYAKFALGKIATGHNQTIFCAHNAANESPYFALFWIKGSSPKFRFDYNDSAKSSSKAYKDADAIIEAEADSSGGLVLKVNGTTSETIACPAAAFTGQTSGPLLLFTSRADAPSNPACIRLYAFRVCSSGGDVLLDLVPMVKDGKAGMYDIVHGKVYTASLATSSFREMDAGARIENADPFFADALCAAAVTGPTLFSPSSAITVSDSITNAAGGILNGTATLTLTGENNWGGTFSITNGTLVAGFGQGLAATDCLHLRASTTVSTGAYGGYGGWNGRVTQSFGSGAGQIYVTPNSYYAFCAADGGELEVNIGGAGAPWKVTSSYRRLVLNGAAGAGTLHFVNPIALADALIVRLGYGTVFFDQCFTNAVDGKSGHTMNLYNLTDNVGTIPSNKCIFRGADNHCLNFRQFGGNYVLDEGVTNTVDGTFTLNSGSAMTFLATNAVVRLTGADGGGGWMYVYGGKAEFRGGELYAGGIYIGEAGNQASVEERRPCLVLNGKVYLEAIGSKSYGSLTIDPTARGAALTIEAGADISLNNLVFHRRNLYHRGGRLQLRGGQGVCQMGQVGGTSRYWLYKGAELVAPRFQGDYEDASAQLIFVGGKLTTSSSTFSPFFQNFGTNSMIYVASADGAEFCVTKNTAVEKGMIEVTSSTLSGHSTWNYAAADWLTAPAFKKSGDKTLTMSGTNTYKCATDVAAGTLRLADGELPGVLPTNGVVRVTGGTLDLGGNEQTVRALVGTAGAVTNGTLVAKEGIYPGGAGAVGSFTCGAALDGELHIDVDASTRTADRIVANGTLDLSGIDLVLPESIPETLQKFRIVEGATTGAFRSVSGLPNGWEIMPKADGLWAQKAVGMTIIFR